jgi:hypothetical protein
MGGTEIKLQLIHDSKRSSPEYTPDISKLNLKIMFSMDTDLTLVSRIALKDPQKAQN